jgi:hypothetical protein
MYQNMRSICKNLTPLIFALLTPIIYLSLFHIAVLKFAAELGDGHNMPLVGLGDRNAC